MGLQRVMKIRTITVGVELLGGDFANGGSSLAAKVQRAKEVVDAVAALLRKHAFEVQTTRLCTSSFEQWTSESDRLDRVARLLECALVSVCHCAHTCVALWCSE